MHKPRPERILISLSGKHSECVLGAILKYAVNCYHPVTANSEQKRLLYSFYLTASLGPSIPSPPSQPVVKRSWGGDSSGKIIQ